MPSNQPCGPSIGGSTGAALSQLRQRQGGKDILEGMGRAGVEAHLMPESRQLSPISVFPLSSLCR